MLERVERALDEHRRVAEALRGSAAPGIVEAVRCITACYGNGGKVLAFGNGGSAADAQHFVAELVGRYKRERRGVPAVALTVDPSVVTAIANDYGYDDLFARQVAALARPGDVAFALSTSGNSENVCRGLAAARSVGARTLALGGGTGGRMKDLADVAIVAPTSDTPRIQECHIAIIHVICELVEDWLVSHDGG